MHDTAIQESAPAPHPRPTSPSEPSIPTISKRPRGWPYQILVFCASLRITVVLFVLAFMLVFFGTWAQVDFGIWTVVNKYFRGWGFTWIPLNIVFLRVFDIPDNFAIPFPRGYTIGAVLLTNLLAAHAIRFKFTWKRSGILILHSGIVLMMLGEFITGEFAIEGRMVIVQGYAANHVDSDRKMELAVVDRSDPKLNDEIIIPHSLLAREGVIRDKELPFDIEVVRFMPNSKLKWRSPEAKNPATLGIGLRQIAVEQSEISGVDPNQAIEVTSAYVKFTKKVTGADLGTYLVSTWFNFLHSRPESVSVDGRKFEISLRPQRSYRDYTIHLQKFEHDFYPGTEVPRNYASNINLVDPGQQENRNVKIWMNHPLRYQGETFYQSGVNSLSKGTILQVVRNPGWLLPYFSCGLVALGMIIHFGIHLTGFLRRQLA